MSIRTLVGGPADGRHVNVPDSAGKFYVCERPMTIPVASDTGPMAEMIETIESRHTYRRERISCDGWIYDFYVHSSLETSAAIKAMIDHYRGMT